MAGQKIMDAAYETTASVAMPSAAHKYKSHLWTLFFYGTYDVGTTTKLQISPDETSVADGSSNWFDVTNASFSDSDAAADRVINVEFRAKKVRIHVTGGSIGNDSITAILV